MSPEEVAAATQGRTDVPKNMKNKWYLCGDVADDIWDALITNKEKLGFRITAFTTPGKTAYVAFSVQAAEAQIRFLLQLGASRETRFLSEAADSGVLLSLARDNSDQALIREFVVAPGRLAPVVYMSKASRALEGEAAMAESLLAVSAMHLPATVPSTFTGRPVTRVCVIAILPEIATTYH